MRDRGDQGVACSTLKKRRDFLRLSASGKKFVTGTLVLQLAPREPAPPDKQFIIEMTGIRVGYTVTKKIGNAVMRNRIKRRFREAVRQIAPRHGQDGQDYALIARYKAAECGFSDILRDMEFAFSRIATMKVTENTHKPARKKRR